MTKEEDTTTTTKTPGVYIIKNKKKKSTPKKQKLGVWASTLKIKTTEREQQQKGQMGMAAANMSSDGREAAALNNRIKKSPGHNKKVWCLGSLIGTRKPSRSSAAAASSTKGQPVAAISFEPSSSKPESKEERERICLEELHTPTLFSPTQENPTTSSNTIETPLLTTDEAMLFRASTMLDPPDLNKSIRRRSTSSRKYSKKDSSISVEQSAAAVVVDQQQPVATTSASTVTEQQQQKRKSQSTHSIDRRKLHFRTSLPRVIFWRIRRIFQVVPFEKTLCLLFSTHILLACIFVKTYVSLYLLIYLSLLLFNHLLDTHPQGFCLICNLHSFL
jgi:hypothetical protein